MWKLHVFSWGHQVSCGWKSEWLPSMLETEENGRRQGCAETSIYTDKETSKAARCLHHGSLSIHLFHFFGGLGDAASAQSLGFFGDCQLQVSKFQVWNAKVLEEFLEYVKQSSLSGMEDWRCRFKSDHLSVADPEMNWSIPASESWWKRTPAKHRWDDDG